VAKGRRPAGAALTSVGWGAADRSGVLGRAAGTVNGVEPRETEPVTRQQDVGQWWLRPGDLGPESVPPSWAAQCDASTAGGAGGDVNGATESRSARNAPTLRRSVEPRFETILNSEGVVLKPP